jgi:hypothetical protein
MRYLQQLINITHICLLLEVCGSFDSSLTGNVGNYPYMSLFSNRLHADLLNLASRRFGVPHHHVIHGNHILHGVVGNTAGILTYQRSHLPKVSSLASLNICSLLIFPEISIQSTSSLHTTQIHSTMPGKTLVVLGSGPGIGIAVAKVFSVRGFTHVALVSRNKDRLAQDEDQVLDAIQERGYSCRVKTWVCDIADMKQLQSTLKAIELFGSLECVLFNPARVAGLPPLEESAEAIEADFRVRGMKSE